MPNLDRSVLWRVEAALALAVLLLATALLTTDPGVYPRWPTLGGVPVNPELITIGVLGVVVLVDAGTNGPDIWSIVLGALGVVAILLAASSLYTLYASNSGVFFGGFFTLVAGVPLAFLVLSRQAAAVIARRRR